jgi:hypothetical protein
MTPLLYAIWLVPAPFVFLFLLKSDMSWRRSLEVRDILKFVCAALLPFVNAIILALFFMIWLFEDVSVTRTRIRILRTKVWERRS